MKTEELQQWIKQTLYYPTPNRLNPKRMQKSWINKHYPEHYDSILQQTSFLTEPLFKERIYCILHNITEPVLCKNCNTNPVNFYKKCYHDFCSHKCAMSAKQTLDKKKVTKGERYGDPNYNNREKMGETCERKYGYKHHWMNPVVQQRRKEKWIENHGVDNPSKLNWVQEEKNNTCLKNHGVKHPYQSEEVKQRGINTNLIIRGVENPFQCEIVKQTARDTKREKYGDPNYINGEKIRETHKRKFREEILPAVIENMHYNTNNVVLQDNAVGIFDKLLIQCENNHVFERTVNGLTYNPFCPYCNIGHSKQEQEVFDFVNEHIKNVKQGVRNIIAPLELDIYLPDHALAIEFDGIYWHSEQRGKDKKYHLNKTDLCNEKGIQLIHVFENEWKYKQNIVKSAILSKIGIYKERYYARNCYIKEIDIRTKNSFLEDNHLQGKDNSSVKLGLFYGNDILAVMTFGKRKITGGNSKFELIRYCSKLNIQVVGGVSKLFTHFLNHYEFEDITTYSDKRYSNGKLYEKIGFKLDHASQPNYWYFKLPNIILFHRSGFQKHRLQSKLERFDPDLTAHENIINDGYDRIWDCGTYVYTYKKPVQ